MEDKKTIGRYIYSKRKEMGFTQKELAERLFVTESAVSKWERGLSYPDITLIRDMCKILNVTEHQLMTAGEEGEDKKLETIALKHIRMVNHYKKVMIIIYSLSLFTCLITNIAVHHKLSWFFVVATSVMTAASLTLVPVMINRRKGIITLGAFIVSLSMLLFTCNIYTGGNWFLLVFVSVIVGLSIFFLPFILRSESLPNSLSNKKVLIYFISETILLLILLILCNLYTGGGWFLTIALPITLFSLTLPWGMMLIIRYLRINRYFKTSFCLILVSIFHYLVNGFISKVLGNDMYDYGFGFRFNLFVWDQAMVSGNINIIVFSVLICFAIVYTILGSFKFITR